MAIQVKKAAVGNAAQTGTPKSLPPTRPAAPDLVSAIRAPQGGAGYGQNSSVFNPSSVGPGKQLRSPLGENLKASIDDEGLLDRVARGGVANSGVDLEGSPQTRRLNDEGDKNLKASPVHPAMAKRGADSGSPGGTVPSKTGFTEFNPNKVRLGP